MMRSLHLTQDMFKLLPMHTMYSMGMAILDDRFPHLTSSPMSLLTPILCKARHQSDCSQVPHLLVYNSPPTADVNMTKLFYLVSTYLMVREWLNYTSCHPAPSTWCTTPSHSTTVPGSMTPQTSSLPRLCQAITLLPLTLLSRGRLSWISGGCWAVRTPSGSWPMPAQHSGRVG